MKNRRWTKEEDEIVRELYPNESNKLIAIFVNRSVSSVRKRGQFLKVYKSDKRVYQSKIENLERANKVLWGV